MKYLTTTETAKKLNVTTGRVRQMILAGQLPAEKFGRDLMIKETDIKTVENRATGRPPKKTKSENESRKPIKTIFDAVPELAGKYDNLPSDLSANKKYLEGLGRD